MQVYKTKTRAIIYIAGNGIVNHSNGIGSVSKTFIRGMRLHQQYFVERYGTIALYLITRAFDTNVAGYSPTHLEEAHDLVSLYEGRVFTCPYSMDTSDYWNYSNWKTLSIAAATITINI